MYSIIIRMVYTENAVVDFGRLGLRTSRKKKQAKNRYNQGRTQSKFEGGTVGSGGAKNFQKLVTRVCCIQQFQSIFGVNNITLR